MAARRQSTKWFEDDAKRILGDEEKVLRSPPSRAEHEAFKELSGLLWGHDGSDAPGGAALASDVPAHLHTPAGEVIEIHCAPWGGQALEYFPWPSYAPECRIWFLKHIGVELLIAMTVATGIPDGHFPELSSTIGPRTQEMFAGSYIEQRA